MTRRKKIINFLKTNALVTIVIVIALTLLNIPSTIATIIGFGLLLLLFLYILLK